jgi:glycosyltransferase involved in cell wall biosynthesis
MKQEVTKMSSSVSFVVIAKNESFGIDKCIAALASICKTNSELIFVDSNSTDDTLVKMQKFAKHFVGVCKIVKCSGYLNAAVARNAGAKLATRDLIFFIDGDTEIDSDFLNESISIFHQRSGVVAITGKLRELIYNADFSLVTEVIEDRNGINAECLNVTFGGNVIVRKEVLNRSNGWDENYRINEDFDLARRLVVFGDICAIPIRIGTHHTRKTDFAHVYRLFNIGAPRFYGSLLRESITSVKMMRMLLAAHLGHIIGLFESFLLVIGVIFYIYIDIYVIFSIAAFLIFVDLGRGALKRRFTERLLIRFLYPLKLVQGFFFGHGVVRGNTVVLRLL